MRLQEKSDFISKTQELTSNLLDNMSQLISLKTEYIALNLGSIIQDTDFNNIPTAVGITTTEFNNALTTIVNLDSWLNTNNNYVNLYKIKK